MRYDDVVAVIRCPSCHGTGNNGAKATGQDPCPQCDGTGINPEVIDEAGGWGSWAITVHDRPGPILVVPLDEPAET